MLLKEIMTTDVEVIEPETSIANAAKKMRSLDVGALPVCDGRRLIGMVTDRDITIRATADARNPDSTFVRDCMSPEIVYCFDDQDVEEAERVMQEKQIRRLPVLTRDKQLAGIVALVISQLKPVISSKSDAPPGRFPNRPETEGRNERTRLGSDRVEHTKDA
jgi:CBS domain-containing protein